MSRNKPTRGNPSTNVAGEPAAVYCRISEADDDDQTGVDRQERICREIAERRGLVIGPTHVFVDNSRSAWSRKRKRPGWDRLLEDARNHTFRHIIAYHPDRLMRQPGDLEELLHTPAGRRPNAALRTSMPRHQTEPAVIQPVIAPEAVRASRQKVDSARDTALQRVCAGFTTTISPQSAARLADLLSASTYIQAA